MSEGANAVHHQLREALENYIKAQYFGKSPILLSAIEDKLDREGVLYRRPYIESSKAYKSIKNGIQTSTLPDWMKEYFGKLADANLGVFQSPFCHQISALEQSILGQDIFVSTGTGSGKTECFIWPLMAKLADEARNQSACWKHRGVRAVVMYPMNALVSDQVSRLRRLIGDPDHRFVKIFRETCGNGVRRPQFGMYTGRTPYAGKTSWINEDQKLAATYESMLNPQSQEEREFLDELIREGRIPAKENLNDFLEKLRQGIHHPDPEDAELVTRFEMQEVCPDILITNYSMLEYMLLRPREEKIWEETKEWLKLDEKNKILFIIDEAHMYRGSSGGEVSYLIRRLFHKLGIDRSRVQFILTTASMPNSTADDQEAVHAFANALTAADGYHQFSYLTGELDPICPHDHIDIPIENFLAASPDSFEGDDINKLQALNSFWGPFKNGQTFGNVEECYHWLYEHLIDFTAFEKLMKKCRGEAVSLQELAQDIFPHVSEEDGLQAVSVLLAIATLARKEDGSVLFPARMHMLFRGLQGVFACTNPNCPRAHHQKGLTVGEVYFDNGTINCKACESKVYELYNDRRCGSLFFKGYALSDEFEKGGQTYLWHQPGSVDSSLMKEIHLYIPENGFKANTHKNISPCYLDMRSGFIDFQDDTLDGQPGIRKLYYSKYVAKGKPDIATFSVCPHCDQELSTMKLTPFSTRGNLAFYNLIQAQFHAQPAAKGKTGKLEKIPNEGRKVLLFSDSRQRAAKLARDLSDASTITAARQLAALGIDRMEKEQSEFSLNEFYSFFSMAAVENNVHVFGEDQQNELLTHGKKAVERYQKAKESGRDFRPRYTITDHASDDMKATLLRLYCSNYNTLTDTAVSWIEPTQAAMDDAIEELEDSGITVDEELFLEVFNAWILTACESSVALGHTIPDTLRLRIRPNFSNYGLTKNSTFSKKIIMLMGWDQNEDEKLIWEQVLQGNFLEPNQQNFHDTGKYYIDLSRVKPRFDFSHEWFRCEHCSRLTPYLLRGKCPRCKSAQVHVLTAQDKGALDFWRKPICDAVAGKQIRVLDTEEHTAQLSHKDQRDDLWSKTEEYELRFQDFLKPGQAPVDILSSTTTMEVGIDIGSLVAVGLRNIPPMRENYQQRAGRAGRRGSSLSTIVTYCEDGPHDAMYFANPVPMFRGDARRPWIDVKSEKIVQRHLSLLAIQAFLAEKGTSMDSIAATDFLDQNLLEFFNYLSSFEFEDQGMLVPQEEVQVLKSYKKPLVESLEKLEKKRNDHPELFDPQDGKKTGKKSLLDALYEEGIIPTYSFPKDVVSTYISGTNNQLLYQVERGLDMAIGEYAPGRSIVVDKETYEIGGLYVPFSAKDNDQLKTPARAFIEDPNYNKDVLTCAACGWFGLAADSKKKCPFCGNPSLSKMRPLLRPWGFAPKNGKSVEVAQLNESYSYPQPPIYSTIPDKNDVSALQGFSNIKMAIRSNQRIIMLNKGPGGKGFTVCCDCGAAVPAKNKDAIKNVKRPYWLGNLKTPCKHINHIDVNLGYDFITDMLVLEFKLDPNKLHISFDRKSWLNRGGQSLAEALRLAACNELDIEFGELVTGYRIRDGKGGSFLDIYLYDSLSSGAGYAVTVAQSIDKILDETRNILDCDCDSACYQCLKHYKNQNVHPLLDHQAAMDLLNWGQQGVVPDELTLSEQLKKIRELEGILLRAGVRLSVQNNKIMAQTKNGSTQIYVYPALRVRPVLPNTVSISDAELKYAKPMVLSRIMDKLE